MHPKGQLQQQISGIDYSFSTYCYLFKTLPLFLKKLYKQIQALHTQNAKCIKCIHATLNLADVSHRWINTSCCRMLTWGCAVDIRDVWGIMGIFRAWHRICVSSWSVSGITDIAPQTAHTNQCLEMWTQESVYTHIPSSSSISGFITLVWSNNRPIYLSSFRENAH